MIEPDMLEHPDRDDAVVLPDFFTIVAQVEPDPVGEPGRGGTPRRELMLLDREGQTGHIGAAFGRKVECETTPAGTDVEDLLPGPDQQLCCEVLFFVELSGIQVLGLVSEIAAGILPVPIEKQLVELVRQVVVMSDVLSGARQRIVLMNPAEQSDGAVQQS